jgi:hypothetical protein
MILHLFIPGSPKNANARSQWAKHATNRDRQKFRLAAAHAGRKIIDAGDWTALPFTQILARRISPVRRRRDPTGLAEQLKGILDGLVDAGIIPDDDEDHISLHLLHSRKGPEAGIDLTLFEVSKP